MFGKLTLEKIEKYLFENSGATMFIHQNRNPIEAVLLLDNAWAGWIFQKYKVWLNHEQKWYLFLSLCERLEVDIEEVLYDLSDGLVNEMAMKWLLRPSPLENPTQSLESAKHSDIEIFALYEYVINNPSLQRGTRVKKLQLLVHDWYDANSLAELHKIRSKIYKMREYD